MSNAVTEDCLNDYFKAWTGNIPRIECEDGFSMSVQVGNGLYCSPRDNSGPWYKAEIGFPSEREDLIMEYIDGDEYTDPTDTVYGYVPVSLIVSVINKHGGSKQIKEDA